MNLVNKKCISTFSVPFKQMHKRWISNAETIKHRSELFTLEQKRQRDKIGRIEKIEVRYLGLPYDTTLIMNKSISTPYHCAQHLSKYHTTRSALAIIDGTTPWDMHRPLTDSCTIQLLNFTIADAHIVNKTFWRSCSFMLGAVLKEIVHDELNLQLHSFPSPNVKSGSFVHDISIKEKNWKPNKEELRAISGEMVKLAQQKLSIQRLEVHHELALEMFKHDPYKREQLPSISRSGSVILYRIGEHVDISRGPMIASTGLLGKCSITSVHKICDEHNGALYRVQGVALPVDLMLNHFYYKCLEDRSMKLNAARLPTEPFEISAIENRIA